MTDRERFCLVLASNTLRKSDAIVLLTGDGVARVPAAVQLLRMEVAQRILVSGGLVNPPHSLPADELAREIIAQGVSPDRIDLEPESMNTHEQAHNVIQIATKRSWTHLTLLTSPYHQHRAFLTFVQALTTAGIDKDICVMMASGGSLPWWETPAGMDATRLALLDDEFDKITRYKDQAHVAGYRAGLRYLEHWAST